MSWIETLTAAEVAWADIEAARRRRDQATSRRDVTIRPDHGTGMAWLSAYLPAAEAVAVMNSLNALATRTRDQDAATADGSVDSIDAYADTPAEVWANTPVAGWRAKPHRSGVNQSLGRPLSRRLSS